MRLTRTVIAPRDERPSGGPPSAWLSFLAALQFLTRLPVGNIGDPATHHRHCAAYFPLAGALIGATVVALVAAAGSIWPLSLAVLIALASESLLTGSFHEDALADYCDAFGGGLSREQVLTILKDSRIGTYGGVALILGILLRAGATYEIVARAGFSSWPVWSSAIIAAAVLSRWTLLFALTRMPSVAGRESLSQPLAADLKTSDLLTGSFWCLFGVAPFAYCMPKHCLLALALAATAAGILMRQIQRKLGGVTGDCLGCVCFIVQTLTLLAAAARFD